MIDAESLRSALLAGDHAEAWRIYQVLRETGQAGAEAHHLGGRTAVARGDLHSARCALEAALAAGATGETLGQARLILGEVRRRTGNLTEAAETLERFLADMPALYPELGPLWRGSGLYNLGLTYRQLNRLAESRAAYTAAADECRREGLQELLGRTLWNLAWVLCLAGDTEAAREALSESEAIRSDKWARWHQLIGRALLEATEGWRSSTTAICRRIMGAAEAPPDVAAHAHWLLGREALRQGDVKRAMAMAEAALAAAGTEIGENRALLDAADLWRSARLRVHELESDAAGA